MLGLIKVKNFAMKGSVQADLTRANLMMKTLKHNRKLLYLFTIYVATENDQTFSLLVLSHLDSYKKTTFVPSVCETRLFKRF